MASLDLLLTFLEIYRAGSLSAAAQRLGLSQPAVTGQLARLEEQLGEQLFIRTSRGVTPTPGAAALASRVGRPLDEIRDVLSTANAQPTLYGTVRVGGAAEVMSLRVLPALAPLTGRGVCVHATLGLAEDLLSLLDSGQLDLVVSAVRPTHEALRAVPLIDEEFVLVAQPSVAHTVDPERLSTSPAEALAHLPLVTYSAELPIIRRYWRTEFGHRPPNPVAVIVPDLRAVLAAVTAGAGVSVLPRYIAAPALASGDLVQLHHSDVAPLNTLYLATRRQAPDNPALPLLHNHLRQAARDWGSL